MDSGNYTILHTEWSSGWGGQEQRIILECRKMIQLGHKPIIACQPESGILKKAHEHGIPAQEVVIRGSFDIRAILSLARMIRKHNVTVVNTHSGKDSWVGGFAAKMAAAPLLVRTRHLSVPVSGNPLNFVNRMADGIVTTGESIRDAMITNNGILPDRIVSIPTGVSVERFNPATVDARTLRRELGIPDGWMVVTMVAVLRAMKRQDLFVKAAHMLKDQFPQVKYLLVGEGSGRQYIERDIREAGMQEDFILTGYRNDIPEIFALSDVAVLTSDRFEGVPQSLSQAMTMGKAVVAAPVGSIPELIRDGRTGLMADTGDARSFADRIGSLLANGELRSALGANAREHILSGYTDEIMAEKTVAFYRHLLKLKMEQGRGRRAK